MNPLNQIRNIFPLLERLSPRYFADRLFYNLFLRTFPVKYKSEQVKFLESGERRTMQHRGKTIESYFWTGGEKTILFVHGWMGHSAQFQNMIQRFLEEGYSCLAFDAPAHGLSTGRQSSLPEFRDAIWRLLGRNLRPF